MVAVTAEIAGPVVAVVVEIAEPVVAGAIEIAEDDLPRVVPVKLWRAFS